MEVTVLYRDLRTYGEREDLYHEAREKGVVFIRYDLEHKPDVQADQDHLNIRVWEPVLGRDVRIKADVLTLATAIVPSGNGPLARLFHLPFGDDGFFMEAHAKLRPVDFATEGVFLCGLAHYPKSIDESIAQALAAAGRAAVYLASEEVMVGGVVAESDPVLCSGCGVCIAICPFDAPYFSEKGSVAVNPALCKGCGLCQASCRSGAIRLKGFDDAQVLAMIQAS